MSETVGIETRSRSRSKTPGLLFGENGDSEGKKATKKVPTISLIEEEEEIVEITTQSQRPKRQRKSAKAVTSDTSGDVESPRNSQKTVTETKSKSTKEVTNGSQEKASTPPQTSKQVTTSVTVTEAIDNQSIFNNIFNAIKTSTPILTSKRSKRITQEVSVSPEVDIKQHPAYKEYKEAGEYWNKFPKTDYTYSELSPHRRQLGNGIVNMPNMSRRSLEKYQQRVETMIQNNPQDESFLRRKFLSNSFQKRSADLQYDSADEVDVSELHQRLVTRNRKQSNFFYRFYLLIVSAFASVYSSAQQGVRKIFYYRSNQTPSRYTYQPVKTYGQSGIQRFFNAIQKFILLCASKVYLLISTILCFDTWLLYTRSAQKTENKKRKRFLLLLLMLLPLLLFGGTYIYLDPPKTISLPKITLPSLPKISLPSWKLPALSWPEWLKMPSFSFNWPSFSLPTLTWPSFLTFSFSLPTFTLPEWFKLPSISFTMPSFSLPSFEWPAFLTFSLPAFSLPAFSLPEWFKLPNISFSLPSFSVPSFEWPSWLTFSLPEFKLPSISFEFLAPVYTYTSDAFSYLKNSSIEVFDKIRETTFGLLNEAQIVWSENFNSK